MMTIAPEKTARLQQINAARAHTDALFRLLHPGALYERPIPERHRLIFYTGHLEAFDWNLIGRRTLGLSPFHPAFDKLFEFGIDPEPGKAAADQPSDWPSVHEIEKYSRRVREALDRDIDAIPEEIFHTSLEHRWMHAETLSYLFHALPYSAKVPADQPEAPRMSALLKSRTIEISPGKATLGQNALEFGWDNEFASHSVPVPGFAIAKFKVTNGDYLRFLQDGGEAPHFWFRSGNEHFYRGMFETIPLPLDWPVYATQEQAAAYARWAGKSLPTEEQFHRAAYGTPNGVERSYPWGESQPNPGRGNFDFSRWDPVPVHATPFGDSAFGVSQLLGNGWEWTSTIFHPFRGFTARDYYAGYSANFFDGCHFVMKGGSPQTAACLLRRSFRNWFRPNYPYMYATFRLVEN